MTFLSRPMTWAAVIYSVTLAGVAADIRGGYVETDLVVDKEVNNVPTLTDANLVNPWGVGESGGSPFWISDNGAGVSTLHNTQGMPLPLVVSIPAPGEPLGNGGAPTGNVFNIASARQGFQISGFSAGGLPMTAPASFLFSTENGTILGWNMGVNPSGFNQAKAGTYAIIAASKPGAVYKGLAIATDTTGSTFLYAPDFHAGTVDMYDSTFKLAKSFTDSSLPRGYAPFNVVPVVVGDTTRLFVTFAVQDEDKEDDVAGQGHGIVDTFSLSGQMLQRFAQHGQLDSPWGVTMAPAGFGSLGGTLWIGNFGN